MSTKFRTIDRILCHESGLQGLRYKMHFVSVLAFDLDMAALDLIEDMCCSSNGFTQRPESLIMSFIVDLCLLCITIVLVP